MDVYTSLIENGLISAKLRYSKENNAVAIVGLGQVHTCLISLPYNGWNLSSSVSSK